MFLGCTSTGRVGLCFLWFFVQELQKAQPVVVLVLKRLRRRGNGLKSHPTDWEKPGVEPATPGLQDIGLSPTPRRLLFCGRVPWLYQYWPGGFMLFIKNDDYVFAMNTIVTTYNLSEFQDEMV